MTSGSSPDGFCSADVHRWSCSRALVPNSSLFKDMLLLPDVTTLLPDPQSHHFRDKEKLISVSKVRTDGSKLFYLL